MNSLKRHLVTPGLAFCGLGIALLLHPISAHAGTIRDDVQDSLYTALAAQPEYAAVGKISTTIPSNTFVGSGTMVGSEWVLTAAHLVSAWELSADPTSVVFSINGTDYTAMEWIPNASFNGALSSYPPGDLALVRLSGPVSGIAPAMRFTGASEVGSTATIVGYGTTGTGVNGYQDNTYGTKRAGQNVLDALGSNINLAGVTLADDYVLADFDRPGVQSESSLGASIPLMLKYSSAPGDSGGGVFINDGGQTRLAGVIAFGYQVFDTYTNADYGDGMGFTRVNQFNGWIDDQLSAIYWSNGVSGSLANGANWINGAVPGAGNVAVFKGPGTYTVTLAGATSNKRMRVLTGAVTFDLAGQNFTLANTAQEPSILVAKVDADDALLTLTNGTVSAVDVVVAQSGVSKGRLIVSGAGTHLNLSGSATVGSGVAPSSSGIGLIKVDGGASVSIAGRLNIGFTGTVDALAGTIGLTAFDLSGKLAVAGPLTVSADSTWTSGEMSGAGVTTIPLGRKLTISSSSNYSKVLSGRTLENAGTIVWSGSGSIYGAGTNATINNLSGGLFDIQSNNFLSTLNGSGQTFNNAGTLRQSAGAGTSVSGWTVNNTGTVEVLGSLVLQSGGTESGAFNIASGGGLQFAGGTYALNAGTSFINSGNIRIDANATVNVNVPLTLPGNWTLTSNNGTLAGAGTATFDNLTWSEGIMSGAGITKIGSGGTFLINNFRSKFMISRVVENLGTMTWIDTGGIFALGTGVTINNQIGGIFDIQNNASIAVSSGSGHVFSNAGIVRKSAGTGTTTVSWGFSNTGTVEVQTGTLSLAGAVSQRSGSTLTDGTWKVFANSTLSLGGGNITTNQANVLLSGSGSTFAEINSVTNNQGNFAVSDGRAFSTAGALSNSGTLRVSAGGTLTVASTYTQTGGVTELDGGVLASSSPFSLQTGLLAGSGTVNANISSSGTIAPGSSPGALTVNGSLTLLAGGELRMEIGGLFQGTSMTTLMSTARCRSAGNSFSPS